MESFLSPELRGTYGKLLHAAGERNIKIRRVRYDYGLTYRDGAWVSQPSDVSVIATYEPDNQAQCESLRATVTSGLSSNVKMPIKFNPVLKGTKFPTIEEVVPLIVMKSQRKPLAPRKGEFTLFYLWTSKIERSTEYMKINDEILGKHPEWSGRLRIIEMATDQEMDTASKEIKSSFWEQVDHYWITEKSRNAKFWDSLPEKNGPYYILVDSDGFIDAAGDPEWLPLEKTLEKWMNGEIVQEEYNDESDVKDYVEMKVPNPKIFEEYEKMGKEFTETHLMAFEKLSNVCIDLNLYLVIKEDKSVETYGSIGIRYAWYEKYKAISDKVVLDAKALFEKNIKVIDTLREKKLASIKYGAKCEKCGKALGEGIDQYRCVSCDPAVYFCVECIKSRDHAKTMEEAVHPHAFYFIQKDSKNFIDELKIMRVKAETIQKFEMEHRIRCIGCSTEKTNILWKCANCIEQDLCNNCFIASRDPTNPRYEEILGLSKAGGHDAKTHVYVRQDFKDQLAYYY